MRATSGRTPPPRFDRFGGDPFAHRPAGEPLPGDDQDIERRLVCAHCGYTVTTVDERIAVNGNHHHTRRNPLGLEFQIGCFRRAPGCRTEGSGTLEWTWFAGYRWQVAVCLRCGTQLGWRFAGDGSSFFGLIVNRLAAPGPAG